MTSDPSNYHREYSPHGSYSLFQCLFEDSHGLRSLGTTSSSDFLRRDTAVPNKIQLEIARQR